MITLFERGLGYKDENGKQAYYTHPVLFPDMFPLFSGLKFNFSEKTVERNGKVYYFDNAESFGDIPTPSEWMSHAGNSVSYIYYKGMMYEAKDNPSGNTSNVKQIKYLSNNIAKYLIEIRYDINDNPISKRSVPTEEASVGDIGGDGDNDYVDFGDRLPLNALNAVPFFAFGTTKVGDVFAVKRDDYCMLFSQTNRKNPLYTDGVKIDADVSRISVSARNFYGLQILVVDNAGKIIESNYWTYSSTFDGYTYINNSDDEKYIWILANAAQDLNNMPMDFVSPKHFNLVLTTKGYRKVTIADSRNPVAEPIRVPEGDVILADYLPKNSDADFAGYTDEYGESINVNTTISISKDIVINAVYI